MNTTYIDINCDLGEGVSSEDCERDARLMRFISRCNIACGGHAGNDTTMALSIANALDNNLAMGAHPGYPDRKYFGRQSLAMGRTELLRSIAAQVEALDTIATGAGARLDHIKLHGALYNDVEANPELAEALAVLIKNHFPHLRILGLANAALEKAADKIAHPFLREGFMDRRYLSDHQLAPRSMPGAVIEEFPECLQQTLGLIQGSPFPSAEGQPLVFTVDSICLHGDNPRAELIASQLHTSLVQAGISIRT